MTDTAAVAPEVTPAEHKRLRWALVLISLAQLMVVLDSTIANIALLAPALPGIVLHRVFLLGEEATPDLIARIVDQIIIPAATCPHLPTASVQNPRTHTEGTP